MRHLNELGDIYLNLLNEDLQSSINQAKNILKSNFIPDHMMIPLMNVYDNPRFDIPQNRVASKDSNIPALAFWHVADSNFDRIRADYNKYLNTPSLYQQNYLINEVEKLKKEITDKQLFKNPSAKLNLIDDYFGRIVERIHQEYVPPERKQSEKNFKVGSTDENVVYEDENVIVYQADDKSKCIKYGTGSNLCISTRGGGNYFWKYRMGGMRSDDLGMTTYFVVFKNKHYPDGRNKVILIDSLGNENGQVNKYSWNPIFNDSGRSANRDVDVHPDNLTRVMPELEAPFNRGVFQFLPWSDKEKKFHRFDGVNLIQWQHFPYGSEERERPIIHSEIKDLEDMEMAIEAGGTIPAVMEYWKEVEKRFPNDINDLFKKYALLNAPNDENSSFIPYAILKEYLSPSDILKYFEDADEYNLEEYAANELPWHQDSEILTNLVFNKNIVYPILRSFTDNLAYYLSQSSSRKVSEEIIQKIIDAQAGGEYLELFSDPDKYDLDRDNLVHQTPYSFFEYLYQYPAVAETALKLFTRHPDSARWFIDNENNPPNDLTDKIYKNLVDSVASDVVASQRYISPRLMERTGGKVSPKIWKTIINDPRAFQTMLEVHGVNGYRPEYIEQFKKDPRILWKNSIRNSDASFDEAYRAVQRLLSK